MRHQITLKCAFQVSFLPLGTYLLLKPPTRGGAENFLAFLFLPTCGCGGLNCCCCWCCCTCCCRRSFALTSSLPPTDSKDEVEAATEKFTLFLLVRESSAMIGFYLATYARTYVRL